MQRYRVNLRLLGALVLGAILVFGGGAALWRFQVERNATNLLGRAEFARNDGDLEECANLLGAYLSIRRNDPEAMEQLSDTLVEIAESPDAEPKDLIKALSVMQATVLEQPENDKLRRKLVDFLIERAGNLKSALDNIDQLLNRSPGDRELELLKSRCLFAVSDPKAVDHAYRLIGYDKKTGEFDAEKAETPDEPIVYFRVAEKLRTDLNEGDLAEKFIEQMVAANPESGEARLLHAQHLEVKGKQEEADAEVRKAIELDPEDPSVVIAGAQMELRNKEPDKAIEALEACLAKHADEPNLYRLLAGALLAKDDYAGALACFDRGFEAVPNPANQALLFYKARLQVEKDDREGARKAIAMLREAHRLPNELIDYLGVRLMMSESKWFEAASELDRLQTALQARPELATEAVYYLGFCYEKLGQFDRALNSYELALQNDPTNTMAQFGRTRVEQMVGRSTRDTDSSSVYDALARELAKPESKQDWVAFDKLIERYSEKMQLGEAMRMVLEGEVLMRRGLYDDARAKLVGSYKLEPKNLGVRRAAVKLFALDPDQGPVKAMKLLDKVVADFGDLPILRLERADLLVSIGDEDLKEQLLELTKGMDSWPSEDQVMVWSGLAGKFERMRDRETSQYCLEKVVELSPGDLQAALQLFATARESDDDAGMKAAQDKILRVVGSKNNATYQYTQAHRLISRYRSTNPDPQLLAQASDLLDKAIDQRAEWNAPYLLRAEISILRNDEAGALRAYDRAAELGRPTAVSLYQHVKLLTRNGRYSDALREIEKIGQEARLQLVGQDYADSLLATGQREDAVVAARAVGEAGAKNAAVQLWLGQFLARASAPLENGSDEQTKLLDDSGKAFEKAVELNPAGADGWLSLVAFYVARKQPVEAEDAIRRAQLRLVEDESQLVFARCYELIGRAIDAEALYKLAYRQAIPAQKVRATRLLAQFYLGAAFARPEAVKIAKASPLINEVLRAAAEGKAETTEEGVRWCRSVAARLLAQSGEYQKLLDAERLLSSNVVDGKMNNEDRLLMAEILAPRPEPVSRLKAVAMFEEVRASQPLSLKAELDLAKLYFKLDQWRKCRERLVDMTARYPDSTEVRLTYLNMLLDRGGPTEVDLAVPQLKRLQELAPDSFATRELIARVAMKRGKRREAVAALRGMLPANLAAVTPEQIPVVKRVGTMLIQFEDLDGAQKLFEFAAEKGGVVEKLDLASFLGQHRDPAAGLDRLESLRDDAAVVDLAQRGLEILRSIPAEEVTPEQIARVQGWLTRGLREDPDLVGLRLQQAELLDIEKEYEKAADMYRSLLSSPDLTGLSRAVVLNNLAYMLAQTSTDEQLIAEASKYVDEAVDLLGPVTDILDTRAVLRIAQKQYSDAVADLELAVIDSPTASKYFHLATAHLLQGDEESARQAWDKALELGLKRETISAVEQKRFDEVRAKLGGAELRSASL